MRYPLDLQQKIIFDSEFLSPEELSEKYKIPVALVRQWLPLKITDEKFKYSVRQKFYNIIPPTEAAIEVIFSKFVSPYITDKEWDGCSQKVSKVLIDFAYKVYKKGLADAEK
jgi:hypothetical protein